MALILIVEDESNIAEVLREFFELRGFRVDVETDGAHALDRVQHVRPDLIILDLMMPVINGAETARRLRRNPATRDIPIVAISAINEIDELEGILMVDDLIAKPFDLEQLGDSVYQLLATIPQDPTNGPAAYP